MLSHQIAFTVSPQHLIGLITALLLFSATRRVTGLVWAGLLPAPMVLLGPDEILLEHAIMSEGWAIAIATDLSGRADLRNGRAVVAVAAADGRP